MASTFGTTSLSRTRRVVRAMARCSSVKSSGVKISSRRPIFDQESTAVSLAGEASLVAHDLVQPFENAGGALAAAYAHCYHSVFRFAAFHFAQDRGREFRARAAQRMAQRDCAAVDVDAFGSSPLARITASACTAKASLSSMRPMSSIFRPASPSALGIATHRADAHDFRRHAARGEADEARFGLEAQLLRFLFGHHQRRGGAIAGLRGIAGGDGSSGMNTGFNLASASREVSARGPSSLVNMVRMVRFGAAVHDWLSTFTGTISSSKLPSAWARSAFWWLR